jgi:hypoxanthine phosphoribosyltransferase
MTKKRIVSFRDQQKLVGEVCRQIATSGWRPDYVVGITRGGLQAAVMISHYFDIPMHTLKVSLRDDANASESNLWMAQDALGYPLPELEVENDLASILAGASELLEMGVGKDWRNILIVDDINDTGATINWIMDDWQSSCLPNDEGWADVWNSNVKFAVLFDNLASQARVKMDFVGEEINKEENPEWIVFPYEAWWK